MSKGVKFIKINKIDVNGRNNSERLRNLENIKLRYNDIGIVEYKVLGKTEYSSYFLYNISPVDVLSLTDNTLLNNLLVAEKKGATINNRTSSIVRNYTEVGDTAGWFTSSLGTYTIQKTSNRNLSLSYSLAFTNTDSSTGTYFTYLESSIKGILTSSFTNIDPGVTNGLGVSPFPYIGVEGEELYIRVFNPTTNGTYNDVLLSVASSTSQTPSNTLIITETNNINSYDDDNYLMNNIDKYEFNNSSFKVEYDFGSTIPSNLTQILSGSAAKSNVQYYNYVAKGIVNSKYEGTKLYGQNINKYTEGDISYGKTPVISSFDQYFAYFDYIEPSPELYAFGGRIHIKKIIDSDGTSIDLNSIPKQEAQYIIENLFKSNTTSSLYYSSGSNIGKPFRIPIYEGGYYYQTILKKEEPTPATHSDIYQTCVNDACLSTTNSNTLIFNISNNNVIHTSGSSGALANATLTQYLTNNLNVSGTSYEIISFQKLIINHGGGSGDPTGSLSLWNVSKNEYSNPAIDGESIYYYDTLLPIRSGDYIRIGYFNYLDNPSFGSETRQITSTIFNPTSSYSGSLVISAPFSSALSSSSLSTTQTYRIYRRIRSENFVSVPNYPTDGTGLLIPENYDPNLNVLEIAKKAQIL